MRETGKKVLNDGLELNLGCGLDAPTGWINIDSSLNARLAKWPRIRRLLGKLHIIPRQLLDVDWPRNIMIHDLRKGLPFGNDSVSYIYASHLLEHLTIQDALHLIAECYRVLKPNGVLLIIVPDLRQMSEKYVSAKLNGLSSETTLAADEFMRNLGTCPERQSASNWIVDLHWSVHNKNLHKWMYDESSVAHRLREAGFVEVTRKTCFDSAILNIELLDKPSRFESAVCLEAAKKGE